MLSLLKVFVRGIVVTLLSPIILLILVLYGVYCIGLFIFMFFKGVIDYFRGKTFNADLPEDLEARRMLLEKEKQEEQAKDMLNMMYESTMARSQYMSQNNETPNIETSNNSFDDFIEKQNQESDFMDSLESEDKFEETGEEEQ